MLSEAHPERIVRILKMHTDTFSPVRINGELSDWFETVMGVLQRCVLSSLQHIPGDDHGHGFGSGA